MSRESGGYIGSGLKPSVRVVGRKRFPLWLKGVLFGAAYFACAEGSTLLNSKSAPSSSFWLPAGLYVAVLLLNENRAWPWLILSAIAGNIVFDIIQRTPPLLVMVFILGNSIEAVAGAWMVRRFVVKRPCIDVLRDYVGLLIFAGVISPLLGGTVSATGQFILGVTPSFGRALTTWWGSTAMATLIVSPFVLAWFQETPDCGAMLRRPKRVLEALLIGSGLVGAVWWIMVHGQGIKSPNKSPFLLFLIWGGLRFGVRGATAANLVLSVLCGFCIQHYHLGLTPEDLAHGNFVLTMQSALAVATIVGLIPAIVLAEHDRTLENLRESEHRFQLAVQGARDGIWDWNILTNEVFYSDRFCGLLGYSRAEFPEIFASFESALHPDEADRVLQLVAAHLKERQPYDAEFRMKTKSGEYRWYRGRGQAVWDERGNPVRMAGSLTDVTTTRLSAQLIRESEEKFSKAFRSSPNGIAITELATGRYIDVNDSFSQIFGYTKEQMLGRTSVDLGVFPNMEDRERVIGPLRSVGRIKDAELRMRTPTGENKVLLFSAERIDLGGSACIVLTLFDITVRLQIEERLEKTSQQLRALTYRLQSLREEERTHLAREIHDHLGQLLTALSLDLRLIDRRAATVADGELRAALHNKITAARALADETITAVQKIATELRPAILDRLGLEAAIETETQAFQARSGIHCQWNLPSAPMPLGPDQATGVFRIFQEVLTNVARHAHAQNVNVRLAQEDEELVLEVDDDGVGIAPEDNADPTSLGLLGMKERAVIMGGSITFDRGEQGGTKVVIHIPLQRKAEELV